MKLGLAIIDRKSNRARALKNIFETAGGEKVAVVVHCKGERWGDADAWKLSQLKLTVAHRSDVGGTSGEQVDVFYTTQFRRPQSLEQVWIWRDVREKQPLSAEEAEAILEWACNGKKWEERPSILRPRSVQPNLAAVAVLAQAALRAQSRQKRNPLRAKEEWLRLLTPEGGMNALLGQLGQEWPEARDGQKKWSQLHAFVRGLAKDDGGEMLDKAVIREVLTLVQWGLQ